jgi:NAD(P)H-nitrite reductase large subunit
MDEQAIRRDISTVCRCKAVRYKTIRLAIESGADTLEKVRRMTKANTGCGVSCTEKIQEMIKEHKK